MSEKTTLLSLCATGTVLMMTESSKPTAIPIDNLSMSLSQRSGNIVFISNAHMRINNVCSRLHELLLHVLRDLGEDQKLYWGSDLDYGLLPLPPDKLYEAASNRQLGQIRVTDKLLPMAKFLSSVDAYAAETSTSMAHQDMTYVLPKTHYYIKRYRGTYYPWMTLMRRLTDFRMFYGEHQDPVAGIARMRSQVSKLLDYAQETSTWVNKPKDIHPIISLDGIRLRRWYTWPGFIAAMAIAVYGTPEESAKDSILNQDKYSFRECADRLLRIVLSDWASKYYGPEYFDREALDGAKTSDKRIFYRDPPAFSRGKPKEG